MAIGEESSISSSATFLCRPTSNGRRKWGEGMVTAMISQILDEIDQWREKRKKAKMKGQQLKKGGQSLN